jgi:xylulokinase
MRLANTTPAHLARAAVEGMLCSLADGIDALRAVGVPVERVFLIGGGAQSEAVRHVLPGILGIDVQVPTPGEYVADGAARQAAWVLSGQDAPPAWSASTGAEVMTGTPEPHVRAQYAAARELTVDRPA